MAYIELARLLSEGLKMAHVPVAMAFLQEPPQGVPRYREAVPTACTFWKAAERTVFYATAEDHFNCPIGAITQGFRIPQAVMENARSLIEQMGKLQYLEAAEAQKVPAVKKDHTVIVYGPLKDFGDISVDLVLLIAAPRQAMLIAEAPGAVAWEGGTPAPVLGRPACAVIPSALDRATATASLGCMGSRTFAGIGADELLQAVPAAVLSRLERRLLKILAANSGMKEFYETHKSRYASV